MHLLNYNMICLLEKQQFKKMANIAQLNMANFKKTEGRTNFILFSTPTN